jgi:DNA-directed RNA polymerase subunit RPC12/RpoP
MVKFFCDRCGAEVENLDALLELSIDVTERPNRSVWNWRAEVCRECHDTFKEEIQTRIIAPPVVEENKRKGARKVAS